MYLLQVRLWTLVVGHSLLFSSLFSRVWTVYRCCCSLAVSHAHQRTPPPVPCDFQSELRPLYAQPRWPAGCVLPRVLLLLDSVVLTCWQVLDPLRWAELQQDSQVSNSTHTNNTARSHRGHQIATADL